MKGRMKDGLPVEEFKAENPDYRLIESANYAGARGIELAQAQIIAGWKRSAQGSSEGGLETGYSGYVEAEQSG